MCGIAATWGPVKTPTVATMLDVLAHRGPDGAGTWSTPQGTLGHRRLAIIDVAGGRQPLASQDQTLALVANGEIYNHASLRAQLRNHTFATQSDSEVIVHLYEELGPQAVEHLDGMFAFVVAGPDHVFAARDPLGIKPLYFVRDTQGLIFASEFKALRRWGQQVLEFPPGSWFDSRTGFHRFYEPPAAVPDEVAADDAARRLRETLEAAVCKRLLSDVPVGTFLSGGVDSSIITALARRQLGELHTVCVGLRGSADLAAARLVATTLNTRHHEYAFTADDVAAALPKIIYHLESFDVDLVRSAIPCWFAAREAARYFKVVLTGEGADELFAGYAYHLGYGAVTELATELRGAVAALHNVNLQRVDRMTMAHSIEGRVPFLDLAVVDLALRMPTELKLRDKPPVQKWILRHAFRELLPDDVLWRPKAQFDEGTGTTEMLAQLVPLLARRFGLRAAASESPRALEGRLYRELYEREYPQEMGQLVARWRGAPEFGRSA